MRRCAERKIVTIKFVAGGAAANEAEIAYPLFSFQLWLPKTPNAPKSLGF